MDFIPSPHLLVAFAAAGAVLAVIPGPDMAYFLGKTANGGKRYGFAAMFGASTGLLVHSALAALGLSALLAASAEAFTALKYAGAAYLLWLSFQALRTGSKFTLASDRGIGTSLFRTYAG